MPKLIYRSDDSFVAFGQSGSAVTGHDIAKLYPLVQSVSVSLDVGGARQTSKALGMNAYCVNDIIKQPSVNVDLSYYLSPYGMNEKLCGITGSGTGSSSFLENLKTWNNNIYIGFNDLEPQDGFSEPRDQRSGNWSGYNFMGIGNCYMTKYSLSFTLNSPVKASASFVGDNMLVVTPTGTGSGAAIKVPSKNPSNGTDSSYSLILTGLYTGLGSGMADNGESRTAYNPSVTLPYKCTPILSELQCGGIRIGSGHKPVIQSMSLNIDIDRTPQYTLGSHVPCTRKAAWPLNGSLSVDFLVSGVKTGELDDLYDNETGHFISIKCEDFNYTGTYITYTIPRARLQNATYSCDVNEIYRCNMQFMFDDFVYGVEAEPANPPYDDTYDIYLGGYQEAHSATTESNLVVLDSAGRKTSDLPNFSGSGFNGDVLAVAVQNDGKILVGGSFTTYGSSTRGRLVRLNSDGSLDTTFNSGQTGGFSSTVRAIALQSDGKILVGGDFTGYNGSSEPHIVRLTTSGTNDTTWVQPTLTITGTDLDSGGTVGVYCIAIDANTQKPYIGGRFTHLGALQSRRIARLTTSGTHDTSWRGDSSAGQFFSASSPCVCYDIAINSSGAAVAAARAGNVTNLVGNYTFAVWASGDGARISYDGFQDSSTSDQGYCYAIAIDESGDYIIGGDFKAWRTNPSLASSSAYGIAKITKTGATSLYDPLFGKDTDHSSYAATTFTSSPDVRFILPVESGKFIVGGNFTKCRSSTMGRVVKLDAWGLEDPSFAMGAGFNGPVYCAAQLANGNFIFGGNFTQVKSPAQTSLMKFKPTGVENTTFTNNNPNFNGVVLAAKQQSDLKIVCGGSFTTYKGSSYSKIIRINQDGSIDTSFSIGTGFDGNVRAIAIQSDGKIVVGGEFRNFNGSSCKGIVRLNANGSIDTGFTVSTGLDSYSSTKTVFSRPMVLSICLDESNGWIYIGGLFGGYRGNGSRNLARITLSNGAASTFSIGTGGVDGAVRAIAKRSSGNIIIAGDFWKVGTSTRRRICELTTTASQAGTATTFNNGVGTSTTGAFNDRIYGLLIQSDDKVIAVGDFTTYQGVTATRICRLTTAAALDTFSSCSLNDTGYAIKENADGTILVAGRFSTVIATSSPTIVKLTSAGAISQAFTSDAVSPDNAVFCIA